MHHWQQLGGATVLVIGLLISIHQRLFIKSLEWGQLWHHLIKCTLGIKEWGSISVHQWLQLSLMFMYAWHWVTAWLQGKLHGWHQIPSLYVCVSGCDALRYCFHVIGSGLVERHRKLKCLQPLLISCCGRNSYQVAIGEYHVYLLGSIHLNFWDVKAQTNVQFRRVWPLEDVQDGFASCMQFLWWKIVMYLC